MLYVLLEIISGTLQIYIVFNRCVCELKCGTAKAQIQKTQTPSRMVTRTRSLASKALSSTIAIYSDCHQKNYILKAAQPFA